jgi:transcription initiation factor IIE alpha subunit
MELTMEVNERASYLKGLAEGLELDNTKPEHKIISALIDAVDEISEELQQIRSYLVDLSEDIEMLDQEMELIWDETEDLLSDESEDKGCGHDCCCGDDEYEHLELDCPACCEPVAISEDMFSDGHFACPHCGEALEIDLGEETPFDFEDEDE